MRETARCRTSLYLSPAPSPPYLWSNVKVAVDGQSNGPAKVSDSFGEEFVEACCRNFSRRNCAGAARRVCSLSGAQTCTVGAE